MESFGPLSRWTISGSMPYQIVHLKFELAARDPQRHDIDVVDYDSRFIYVSHPQQSHDVILKVSLVFWSAVTK